MAARRTTTTTRETRVTSRKETTGAEGDMDVVAKPGMGFAEAISIITFLALVAAIVTTDYMLGKHYGTGVFFKP